MADTRQYPNPGDKELPEVNADDEGKVLAVVKGAWDKAGSQIELPVVTSEDNGKLLGVTGGKWDSVNAPTELPAVTNEDNGRILQVSSGAWTKQNMPTELPAVTATDNGKVLGVADGNWGVVDAPSGGSDPLIINATATSSNGAMSIDKTFAELNAAYHSGRAMMVIISDPQSILVSPYNAFSYTGNVYLSEILGYGSNDNPTHYLFRLFHFGDGVITIGEFHIEPYNGGDESYLSVYEFYTN